MPTLLKKFALVVLPAAAFALGLSGCGDDEPSRNYAPTKDSSGASGPKVTTRSSDAATQLTYDGQPLYYYVKDKKPRYVRGDGVESFGGSWHTVKPSGEPND